MYEYTGTSEFITKYVQFRTTTEEQDDQGKNEVVYVLCR